MAGDWIKMRTDLFTHPKVVRISSAMKADALRTVGGLMSVWCLFDAHSEDGQLEGYSFEVVDDLLRWTGFSTAMANVGWLEETPDGLALPRFDAHNGQSSKRRAQDADRKREVRKVSASEADKKRTREEKRREEKEEEITTLSISQSQPAPTPGGRICKAMRQQGLADGNPSNPTLLALIAAGATDDEFIAAAQKAVAEQKGFAYALGIVTGERKRAAALAQQIHHGELPAAATRPTFAQQAADIARTTVPARPGPDPTLAAIEQDAQRAAPPSAEQREKIKQLLRQRPAMATESDSK